MVVKHTYISHFGVLFLIIGSLKGICNQPGSIIGIDTELYRHKYRRPKVHNQLSDFLQETMHNMLLFNKYLFCTQDTYKILVSSAPFYGVARGLVDCPTQNYFYDKKTHRNIHQIAPVFEHLVDPLLAISFITLVGLQFFTHDEEKRLTSNNYMVALFFLWIYKDIIKAIPCDASIRPKNQHFSPCKTYFGGFPSGHTFEAVTTAYLFGAQFGANYAIPLSALAVLVAIQSVAINRHTVSQVIAGAAFGVAFGAAAQKVVNYDLHDRQRYGIMVNKSGGLSLSYEKHF